MKLQGKRKRGTNSLWEERSNTWEWWLVVICGPWTNEKVEDVKKMPKIDTLDALEEHEEHEDDYQTNSNW